MNSVQVLSERSGYKHTVDLNTGIHSEVFNFMPENGKKTPVAEKEDGTIEKFSSRFAKVSDEHFYIMNKLLRNHPTAALIYNFFLDNMDNTNAIIMSYDAMEEVFERSRSTLSKAISFLAKNDVIQIQKSGNMNVYCVNAQLAWRQKEDKKYFARFNATVYITKSEQQSTKTSFTKEIKIKPSKATTKTKAKAKAKDNK